MAIDRQTSPHPKLPLASLALLFLTDATFGWILHDWTSNREMWLLVAFGITILGGCVTYPSRSVALIFGRFFKTDVRALILIIGTSFMSVILLTWLNFFIDTVVLFSAGLLVSLDLKVRGWSKPISLLLIIGWQLLGVSTGLFLHYFTAHPPANLPAYVYSDYWVQFIDRLNL
ncbi:hypothetical protein [Chamaesiphon sp. VAR_48_metabat_135_sub]|uniref:hypothetical protein n=1 Tax=Chamaesiphon sp. VAR_48_metabat_135_sub TaxID=2964699 RepID=UPI00286B18F3|nr:hypothetical protein [Chamaesiphon sp. VAR_48_metabat_135_sub]